MDSIKEEKIQEIIDTLLNNLSYEELEQELKEIARSREIKL